MEEAVFRTNREDRRDAGNGGRLLACCVPITFKNEVYKGSHGSSSAFLPTEHYQEAYNKEVRVLLVSSRSGQGMLLPKGGWEEGETVSHAAQREAYEEAGIRGELEQPYFGIYEFTSMKQGSGSTKRKVFVFLMHVREELDSWPEMEARNREWFDVADAIDKVKHPWMAKALQDICAAKGWQ